MKTQHEGACRATTVRMLIELLSPYRTPLPRAYLTDTVGYPNGVGDGGTTPNVELHALSR